MEDNGDKTDGQKQALPLHDEKEAFVVKRTTLALPQAGILMTYDEHLIIVIQ